SPPLVLRSRQIRWTPLEIPRSHTATAGASSSGDVANESRAAAGVAASCPRCPGIRFRPGCESRTGDSGGPTSCASSSPSTPSPSSSGPLNSTTNFFDAVMQVRVHTVRRLIHACLFQSRSLNKCSERGRYGRLAVSSMCFLTSSSVLQLGCSF
uniref:Uncharacterized protein n=1 Tax=Triticum urartu TaxID=4572 RepID=A0A8R7PMS0_TRIUA